MSLKYFHIFFITISTLLAIGFGIWLVNLGSGTNLIFGILAFLFAAGLVIYGIKVYHKLKNL